VTNTGRCPKAYEKTQNRIIEEAFQNKEKCARLVDADGDTYIVDFELLKEYPENNIEDAVFVIRRDKTG
jgi:hypothetical protein